MCSRILLGILVTLAINVGHARTSDRSTLWVRSGDRISLMIVDSSKNKTGVDLKTKKTFQNIPNSECLTNFVENKYTGDYDELHEAITIEPALKGQYTFILEGIKPGPYLVTLTALGNNGSSLPSREVHGLISEGEIKTFTLDFHPENTANALSVISPVR